MIGIGVATGAREAPAFFGILPAPVPGPGPGGFEVAIASSPTPGTAAITLGGAPDTGVFAWYIGTTSTQPTQADLRAGTGAVSFGAVDLASNGVQGDGPSGLAASTSYFLHYIDPVTGLTETLAFTTAAADTTAPVLVNPAAAPVDAVSITGSVETNEATGQFSYVVTTTDDPATGTQIEAGQDSTGSPAPGSGTQAVSQVGQQNIFAQISGLATGQGYYIQFVHRDSTTNLSAPVVSAQVVPRDITAPDVSAVEVLTFDVTDFTATHFTDTGEGTRYWVIVPVADPVPTVAEMKSGTHGTARGSDPVTAFGFQPFSGTGLTGETEYIAYVMQTDVAGNDSDVVSAAASFTTASATLIAQFFHDGSTAPAVLTNATATADQAGPGAETGILVANNGLGAGAQQVLLRTSGNFTFHDGVNVISFIAKAVGTTAGDTWLRFRPQNISNNPNVSINITDDATPDGSRISNVDAGWTNLSVTSLGSGFFLFEGSIDMTGFGDLGGGFWWNFATAAGGATVPNTTAGEFAAIFVNVIVEIE